MTDSDPVNHPAHYRSHPSGIECIEITEHMGFNLGNAIKYLWRADLKSGTAEGALEDLRKAAWYVQREVDKRELTAHRESEWLADGSRSTDDDVFGPPIPFGRRT